MHNLKQIRLATAVLLFLGNIYHGWAQTETADVNDIDQIIAWGNDGVTKKIIFPEGVYKFSKTMTLENDGLILKGSGKNKTILQLTSKKGALIDAKGNNYKISDLTLDGGKNQKSWGNTIFRFNKSKGHQFKNVEFTNSLWNAITAITAYATDGLVLKNCIFSNIEFMPVQIFNRNTNKRGGEVVLSVDKVLIDGCIFKKGYETAISSDNGNDREDSGDGTGRRYTESTSLNGSIIENCTFEKSKQFHIAMVQTKDVIIRRNTFAGMTDDAGGGCQPIHMEQFTKNIEIYNNTFSMSNTVSRPYTYIHINGTEGHKRVTQSRPSDTYKTWTYNVYGSNERRANTKCAKTGHINKDCKRDVHAYGPRNIYIAGNTFNSSTKIAKYITINEGENIKIGVKKGGAIKLNNFIGGNANTKKISFGGNDEGTGNVLIKAGQNIVKTNVDILDVNFDKAPIRLQKPIVIEEENKASKNEVVNEETLFYPNPAKNTITLTTELTDYSVVILTVSGQVLKVIKSEKIPNKTIDVREFTPGIYVLIVKTKHGNKKSQKLIIDRSNKI
ncbi:Por secretion system C-terminal sorting domain-containing protein [Zobellia uliginosa]|uniref:Por secretion system C-terminal sorting domain-containing protein n=1 Tax=Zobellia uliginosa TaxID=143224 RepID=A0ABY1KMF9_9FLAO|nr:T9SS type A sorting domain-containing protein [Zobellia uliginosa]SIS49043.1 Por secretion system C-terminal sorting domain-containing protein [Zobellia uliginosa]